MTAIADSGHYPLEADLLFAVFANILQVIQALGDRLLVNRHHIADALFNSFFDLAVNWPAGIINLDYKPE